MYTCVMTHVEPYMGEWEIPPELLIQMSQRLLLNEDWKKMVGVCCASLLNSCGGGDTDWLVVC